LSVHGKQQNANVYLPFDSRGGVSYRGCFSGKGRVSCAGPASDSAAEDSVLADAPHDGQVALRSLQ
jgi:hypothetical protein